LRGRLLIKRVIPYAYVLIFDRSNIALCLSRNILIVKGRSYKDLYSNGQIIFICDRSDEHWATIVIRTGIRL